MPALIIAGMPTSVTKRNKKYMPQVDDWSIHFVPSRDKSKPDLRSCWRRVLDRACEEVQGTHVFAYHYRDDEYPHFNRMMRNRHRLVWMERDTLRYFGSDMYTEMIEKHIGFERKWRDMLRPQGVDAPGLLPECSFSPKKHHDLWSRIRTVRLNKDDLYRVYRISQRFREVHYGRGMWQDKRGLQFKVAPAYHGSNPPYGSFKFSYRVPDGFHYDVRAAIARNGFTVRNSEGDVRRFHSYTNIDCHGSIRGGS